MNRVAEHGGPACVARMDCASSERHAIERRSLRRSLRLSTRQDEQLLPGRDVDPQRNGPGPGCNLIPPLPRQERKSTFHSFAARFVTTGDAGRSSCCAQ